MAEWRAILAVAILAPSPHNVQPWRVRLISDTKAELFLDLRRTLPREDTTNMFLMASMGIFLEALRLLAVERGLALRYALVSEPAAYPRAMAAAADREAEGGEELMAFATLELAEGAEPVANGASELLRLRRTSRVSYRAQAPEPETLDALTNAARGAGQRFTALMDAATIEALLQANNKAVMHDLNIKSYHDEIVRWFRFTRAQLERRRDGLDWKVMHSPQLLFWLGARVPQMALWPGMRWVMRRTLRRQIGDVACLGFLSGDFSETEAALQAGAGLLALWLELTRRGMYLQPFGNLVTNATAAAQVAALTGISDAWLVFKLGRSEAPPSSIRRSLDEVLVR